MQPTESSIDVQREELRFALVMNGGVSMAVWMGGVTSEFFRVVTQQHPVYRDLLAMTHSVARVDVISGASAGGVNGAALAMALLYGGDLMRLRETWLDVGAFESLLRAPLGENPGSLLMGDDYFLPEIRKAFTTLAPASTPVLDPQDVPLDLRVTTTLLRGRQGNALDDLGTPVHDVDYRGQFRFRHTLDDHDFAQRDAVLPQIARAARSTASFPFAFEPSFVDGDEAARLVDANDEPLDGSRFVIDGGVLDNKPFRGALRSIFDMPTQRSVRRVLAYVNPDPGDGPPGQPTKDAPPLSTVLSEAVLGIPQSQSISDQLQEIQDHNAEVRSRRNSVVTSVRELRATGLDQLPRLLFNVYRQRRVADVFDDFVYAELPAAARRRAVRTGTSMPVGDAPGTGEPPMPVIGRRAREQLLATFQAVPWRGWLPAAWPGDEASGACAAVDWEWGLFPVEFAEKVMLDLLRRTQQLVDFDPRLRKQAGEPPAAEAPSGEARRADWSDADPESGGGSATTRPPDSWRQRWMPGAATTVEERPWNVERVQSAARPRADTGLAWLKAAWTKAYDIVRDTVKQRADEGPRWNLRADLLLALIEGRRPLADASRGSPTPEADRLVEQLWARRSEAPNEVSTPSSTASAEAQRAGEANGPAAITPQDFSDLLAFLSDPVRRARCGELARAVAEVLIALAAPALELARLVETTASVPAPDRALARGVIDVFEWLAAEAPGDRVCTVLHRLMQLEVVEFAYKDHSELQADSTIELVQVSGNTGSPIGGPREAKGKLLGLQLAHFGAFYKKSWRANDWLFGRLDGSERLVRILLDPERLQRFFAHDAARAQRWIDHIARTGIGSRPLREEIEATWAQRGYAQGIADELAFLDRPGAAVPDALPLCAEAVTLRLHYGILREEIETLLAAVAADRADGAEATPASAALLQRFDADAASGGTPTRPYAPSQAAAALQDGLLGSESLRGEAGTDLFTRTLAHTTATLQSLLASKAAHLGPVSVFFAGLKLPFLGFYFVARGLTRQTRSSAALHGGILAAGLVIVLFQFLLDAETLKKVAFGSTVAAFGWALLAYGLLFSVASAPRSVGVLLTIVASIAECLVGPAWLPLAAVALVVLALSLRVSRLAFLQWGVGYAAIALAARWSNGWELGWPHGWHAWPPVFQCAAAVGAVLLLATWQASTFAQAVERFLRDPRAARK